MNLELYSAPSEFIDSSDPDVQAFAKNRTAGATDPVSRAVKLYYAVRDEILYDPYYAGEAPSYFRASDCLRAGRGFCIPKSALLAAAARSVGIPARVAFADVRNHLSTKKLIELIGSDLFVWHSYTELHLEGRWVKATPAFNLTLCQRFGVRPLEFDGRHDSLFHEYDLGGRRHMEYVRQRGHYPDVPYPEIIAELKRVYPLDGPGQRRRPPRLRHRSLNPPSQTSVRASRPALAAKTRLPQPVNRQRLGNSPD